MMKRLFQIGAPVLVLTTALFAIETFDEYVAAMKAGAGASNTIRKTINADLPATAEAATAMKSAFAEIEAYWKAKGVADAETFAHNLVVAADQIHTAAAAGNQDAAAAAYKSAGANCSGCHMAHRGKDADGKEMIK